MRPRISVIIPAYNEERFLPLLLESLKRQKGWKQGKDFEVIVVDGFSSDNTRKIAKNMDARLS